MVLSKHNRGPYVNVKTVFSTFLVNLKVESRLYAYVNGTLGDCSRPKQAKLVSRITLSVNLT